MKTIRLLISLSLITGFSASFCNFDVRLQQELHYEGFHRNITYQVTFRDTKEDGRLYEKCYIGLDQRLPAGVYASPDELEDLQRMNKLDAIPQNKVNIELPAEDSQPTNVFIIGKVKDGEANLWLPIHARYHRAVKGGGSHRNDIDPPRVLLRCPHLQLDKCKSQGSLKSFPCSGSGKEMCVWKEIYFTLLNDPVYLAVPIGNLDDKSIVASITAAVVVIISLYLLKTIHEYKLGLMKGETRP